MFHRFPERVRQVETKQRWWRRTMPRVTRLCTKIQRGAQRAAVVLEPALPVLMIILALAGIDVPDSM